MTLNNVFEREIRPSISVLMPAYNSERTIRLAAKSALISLPRNGELLIFLDGCSDKTLHILERIRDRRMQIHVSSENVGTVRARQYLLENARSEVIAILDSDDIAMPWRFRRQLRVLRKKEVDFVFGNAVLFGAGVNRLGFRPEWPVALNPRQAKIALTFTNPFINSSMTARKASVEKIGGFKGSIEDLGMWLEAATCDMKMIRTSGYSVFYRVHASQLSRTKAWKDALAKDELLGQLRTDYRLSVEGPLLKEGKIDARFALWQEFALGSFWLMMQNIGIKDYLKYKMLRILRDDQGNYRSAPRRTYE